MSNDSEWVSVSEAAEMLGIGHNAIAPLGARLGGFKLRRAGGRTYYARSDVLIARDLMAETKPRRLIDPWANQGDYQTTLPSEPPRTARACLSCSRVFMSEGIGNRLCGLCGSMGRLML